jgi:ferric-dicitrate binding protein FerR (iron transport regulator)
LGGQYQVRLPDGTKVWLNAASKLTYPASFDPGAERKVELKGEAYFEIAQIANTPFVVFSGKQRIEVEAARLNISSYVNDEAIKTTLLEGMGRINSDNIIKSGQQAINKKGNLEIIPANTKEAVAWKNGLFLFEDESLETIMKSISRWYNVEIIYANENAPKELFSLSVSRFDNISSTLKSLENTGFVRFKIKGRKITVLR